MTNVRDRRAAQAERNVRDRDRAVIAAVEATLRYVSWWARDETAPGHLIEQADETRELDRDTVCCPVCKEITCDRDCPLAPVRDRWQQEADR